MSAVHKYYRKISENVDNIKNSIDFASLLVKSQEVDSKIENNELIIGSKFSLIKDYKDDISDNLSLINTSKSNISDNLSLINTNKSNITNNYNISQIKIIEPEAGPPFTSYNSSSHNAYV